MKDYILFHNKNYACDGSKEVIINYLGCDEQDFNNMIESGQPQGGYECVPLDGSIAMLFRAQQIFQERVGTPKSIINPIGIRDMQQRTQYIKHHAQYVDQELHEMLRELPYFKEWKHYILNSSETIEQLEKAQVEYIDALHFFINIGLALGLTPERITEIYARKNIGNHVRQDHGY